MPQNIVIHWFLLLTALVFIGFSIFYWTKQKIKISLILLTLAALFLRIFVAKDGFLHEWDERYHALVAKNMMDHFWQPMLYKNPLLPFDYREWASNSIWLHKQPIPLWSMVASMKLFGVSAFAIRIPSILLSTILVPVTYGIGKILYNQRVGFIAALLCAIHGLIIEQSGGRVATDHIDLFFLCFIAFAIYTTLRFHKTKQVRYIFLTGLFTACAILSKWLPALIVLPIWCLSANVNRNNWKNQLLPFTGLCLIIIALVLPWQYYIHSTWPLEAAWESSYNRKHIFEALGSEKGGILFHLNKINIIFGFMIYAPLIWMIRKSIKKYNRNLWILSVWIFIPLIFFTLVKTKMQGYLLFTAPAFFLLTALFLVYLQQITKKHQTPWLLRIISLALILMPILYSIERIKPLQNNSQDQQDFKTEYATYDEKTVIFNEPKNIEAMFYSKCAAVYPYGPTEVQIEELKALGYRLILK